MSTDPSIPERFECLGRLETDDLVERYHVRDTLSGREVELERPGLASAAYLETSVADRDRLLREARARAAVRHPNVQVLYEVLQDDAGLPLLVLEHRPGESLAALLEAQGRLPAGQVVRLGRAVAQAAGAVHEAGLVHRGIQESNIRVDPSQQDAVLGGFSFAKAVGGQSSIDYRARSTKAVRLALPAHPAPEQLSGVAASPRSDVFALGCVLYRCLTGRPAWAEDCVELRPPPLAHKVVPEVPRTLAEVVDQCLRVLPAARYPTMSAVDTALVAAADRAARPQRTSRRSLLTAAAGAGLALAAAFGLEPSWRPWHRASEVDASVPRVDRGPGPGSGLPPGGDPTVHVQALIIGIDQYQHGTWREHPLDHAENDAVAVRDAVLELGWDPERVRLLRGPQATRDGIEEALDQLKNRISETDFSQTLVYFAGHGERHVDEAAEGWLIPHDGGERYDHAGGRSPGSGRRWLPYSQIADVFERARKRRGTHLLAILDCCYSGTALGKIRSGGTEPYSLVRLERDLRDQAHIVMTSSRADQLAVDGRPGQAHSPYCEILLDVLAQARQQPVSSGALQGRLQAAGALPPGQEPLRQPYTLNGADFWFRML